MRITVVSPVAIIVTCSSSHYNAEMRINRVKTHTAHALISGTVNSK